MAGGLEGARERLAAAGVVCSALGTVGLGAGLVGAVAFGSCGLCADFVCAGAGLADAGSTGFALGSVDLGVGAWVAVGFAAGVALALGSFFVAVGAAFAAAGFFAGAGLADAGSTGFALGSVDLGVG
ncbi:hypothetical protein, partial [Roseovarius nitratireducens]|uniref:hypothetical protein n=1 Tax=Roseovarius nitratireducens TaxID=2044597 RepID=UPI00197D30C9